MEPRFAETGHVLFVDLVGFSRLPVERQAGLVRNLTEVVRSTETFRRAEADGELVTLPTGDGMALVFFRYPLAPLHCAREIAAAAGGRGDLALRMGIHVGAVTRVTDAAGRTNLSGDGLNQGQRVMDCGDAGHILISAAAAETFKRFEGLSSNLIDLGECTVKHGERLRIFNFVSDGAGLTTVPSRLRQASAPAIATSAETGSKKPASLIYEPTDPPAPEFTEFLERELERAGYSLIPNPQTAVGVEWAQELRRQVTQSAVVIALISEAAVKSELFETQVIAALDAQQHRNGLPLVVPVRVEYSGPLSDSLVPLLGRLFTVSWTGQGQDTGAGTALQRALGGAAVEQPVEAIGGAVPLDSRYYIVRPTDSRFIASVTRRDSIVLVKGARQMGKTSLLTRGLQQAREAGARCFRTDFQKLTSSDLRNEGEFFLSLAEMIAEQVELEAEPEDVWNHRRGGAHNFERFMRRHVLSAPIAHVWALDEVDRLFACPFGTDVFALFRSWHNDRAYEPGGPWSRLTMAIAYATEAHLFITDVNQSPFNVGTRLTLEDFTLAELGELNDRYGAPLRVEALQRFHSLVGGQPYLSRRGLDHLAQRRTDYPELESSADQDEGIFGDHLRRLLITITQDQETLQAVRDILAGATSLPPNVFYRLRSGGLIAGPSHQEFALRCRLYDSYLRRHLMNAASPP